MTYETLSSTRPYTSPHVSVRIDEVRMPDGHVASREIADRMSAVGAVAVDADDRVVLLRQYRHALGRHFLEVPAGKLDVEGEPPADAMQRELAEEVELHAGELVELLRFTNSAGWTTEETTVYLATDLTEVPRPADFELRAEEADMDVLRVPFDEAVAMIHTGEIVDAKTVIGLLAVADRRRR